MTDRQAIVKIGAHFFDSDEGPMFQYTSDPSSIIGPRKATEQDKKDHAGAWIAFLEAHRDPLHLLTEEPLGLPGYQLPVVAETERSRMDGKPVHGSLAITPAEARPRYRLQQLDHDGDGKPGGSLPKRHASTADEIVAKLEPPKPKPAPKPRNKGGRPRKPKPA